MMSSGVGPAGIGERLPQVVLEAGLAPFDHGAGDALLQRQLGARLGGGRPGRAAPEMGGEGFDGLVAGLDVAQRQEDQRLGEVPLLLGDVGVAGQLLGVDDGRVETRLGGVVEEDRVEHLTAGVGQAEADVRDAEDGLRIREQLLDGPHALDGLRGRAQVVGVARAAGEDQRVPPDVLGGHAHVLDQDLEAAPRHLDLALDVHRHPLLVDQAHHQGRAEAPGERHHPLEAAEAVFQVDRVEDRLALAIRQRHFHNGGVGRVDHERRLDQADEPVEKAFHVADLVAVRILKADVEDLAAGLDLSPAHLGRGLVLAGLDELLELAAAEHVGALAHEDGPLGLGELDGFEAGDEAAAVVRDRPRLPALDQLHQGHHVGRARAAAAAHEVKPAGVEETGEDALEDVRPFGIAPLLVWQAGVGHAGHAGPADFGEGAHVVRHQVRAGRAVQTHVQEVGVEQGGGERLGVLAAEHGAGGLDGGRDGDRDLPTRLGKGPLDADQAGLDVARVLGGLQEQVVGAAGHQAQGLDAEILDQPLEGDATRDGDGFGRGPHGAADEAGLLRRRVAGAGAAGDRGREAVELVGLVRKAVLAQHQGRAAEGVGLHDVATHREIALVDAVHHVGPGHAEILVAPLEIGTAEVVRR